MYLQEQKLWDSARGGGLEASTQPSSSHRCLGEISALRRAAAPPARAGAAQSCGRAPRLHTKVSCSSWQGSRAGIPLVTPDKKNLPTEQSAGVLQRHAGSSGGRVMICPLSHCYLRFY